MEIEDISIIAWLQNNAIKNEKGEVLDFKEHRFLVDIYDDDAPNLCVMKAAQVGLSTCEVLRMFWRAKTHKMDVIYTLPTQQDVQTFVGGKVNRIIAQNQILQSYTKDKDTIEQKQVGNSMIYFRGTFTEKEAIMVTADWLIHDEKDSSDQGVVDAYQARLQHSKYKWLHTFSHPSVPGHGVDREWQLSDQKHWFVKCTACAKEQFLEWPESIDVKAKIFVCKHCKSPLENRRRGRWVAKYKGRKYSGYWVNLMMCPWVTAGEIVDKYNSSTIEFFYNKVLGLPYEGEGNTMPKHVIQRCIQDTPNSQENVVIGADSGLIKHWVAGNREGIFAYGKTETWDDIRAMLNRYPRSIAVLDALPDLTAPRELRQEYPGRVYLANFTRDRKTMQLVRWGKGKEEGSLLIDRHRAIQFLVDEFHKGYTTLHGRADEWEDYIKHWQNIYRVKELDDMDRPVFEWKKKNTEDHWVMASTLWRVGVSRFGESKIVRSGAELPGNGVEIGFDERAPLPDPKKLFQFEDNSFDWRG